MSGSRVQHKLFSNSFRNFYRSTIFCENKASENLSTEAKNVNKQEKQNVVLPGSSHRRSTLGPDLYKVKPLDRYLLVWLKKYKSIQDIPSHIPEGTMEYVHSRSRIRIANILIVLTLVGCVWAVMSGKKAVAEGDSIHRRIQDPHKKANEEYLLDLQKQSKST